MITIINISDTKFSYNGINYFKNFTPFVTGNKVSIVNTYDACISLTNFPTIYSDISVDGVIYGSVAALQNALLPVLFNRTFSQSGSLTVGYIPKATGSNILGNSLIYDNGESIGVGTTIPNFSTSVRRVLDINGSSQSMLVLSIAGAGGAYFYNTATSVEVNAVGAKSLYLSNNGAIRIAITPTGNVEIKNSDSRLYGGDNAGRFIIGNPSVTTYLAMYGNAHSSVPHLAQFIVNNVPVLNMASGGNVGINTASPYVNSVLTLRENSTLTNALSMLNRNGTKQWDFSVDINAVDDGGLAIIDRNQSVVRMCIKDNGYVGFGNTNPSGLVHLTGNSSNPITAIIENNGAAVNSSGTKLRFQFNGVETGFLYNFYDGGDFSTRLSSNGYLALQAGGAEKLRINPAGDVLIGKQATSWTVAGSQFEVNGKGFGVTRDVTGENLFLHRISSQTGNFVAFYYNSGGVGSISTNGTSTSYNTSSDYRLKEDLKQINGLDLISKIEVYDYKWKSDESRAYGVLAHELQQVIPQAVNGEKDGEEMQGVDYSKLVPVLIKAIKELKSEIQILKN
jgi:hypothetical protein